MNILIFNGSLEQQSNTTSHKIARYFRSGLEDRNTNVSVFNLSEAEIPIFNLDLDNVPPSVRKMSDAFRSADIHIWLTPLYHGSMTGVMKNCLDWLEVSAREDVPYLTNKIIGLVCWADGGQAMQGINSMDAVAKALRAWVLPYSIPIVRGHLFPNDGENFSEEYLGKFNLMMDLLTGLLPFKHPK